MNIETINKDNILNVLENTFKKIDKQGKDKNNEKIIIPLYSKEYNYWKKQKQNNN